MPDYICHRCRGKFPLSEIKYDRNQKIVCINCLGQLEREEKRKQQTTAQDYGKIRLICINCRYNFSMNKGSLQAPKCPYCGKSQLMQVKRYKDENDLISESTHEKYDY